MQKDEPAEGVAFGIGGHDVAGIVVSDLDANGVGLGGEALRGADCAER